MILKHLKVCLFMVIGLIDNHLYAMERDEDSFKFKIGFEFQEANHLFPQGANNFAIQKKTIFTAMKNDKELWHVEIDGSDIEFVTPPFTVEEREYLSLSMQSIQQACQILKELSQQTNNQVSFQQWIEGIQEELSNLDQKRLDNLNKYASTIQDEEGKQKIRDQIEKIEQSRSSFPGLRAGLDNGITIYTVIPSKELYYEIVQDEFLSLSPSWQPKFMPQVTIQHSLKDTIPLIMGLFGSHETKPTPIEQQLKYAFPSLQDISTLDDREYLTEENGLLFLHAFTCANTQRSSSSSLQDLLNSFATITDNFERYKQVDAKVNLSFLSRRPFSQMWLNIKEKKDIATTFGKLYEDKIINGNPLFSTEIVPTFKFVNYAEEYYRDASTREDLSFLMKTRREESQEPHVERLITALESKDGIAMKLLKQGIVSTRLIAYLYPEVEFPDYLSQAISSVDQPSYRYILDQTTWQPIQIDSKVDALSPPWFQDNDNSMGAYQNLEAIDLSYGEAIIEMRSIKHISRDAFQSINLGSGEARTFLAGTERPLSQDMESMLSFLNYDFILTSYKKVMEKYR